MSDGSFPDKLLNLPNLLSLYIRANGFSTFPLSIASLPKLMVLDLSFTNYSDTSRLSSTIDVLKQSASLKTLLLANCYIQGLPPDFDGLKIETLFLNNNVSLNPDLCQKLGDMPNLKSLFVTNCNLTSLPSNLQNSSSLRDLWASSNKLYPPPSVLMEIPNLHTLDLGLNGIAELPSWFGTGSMNTLKDLRLDNNQLVTLPDNFIHLSSLTTLSINNNRLNGTWPTDFDTLKTITTLNLANNQIDTLPDLSRWTALKVVQLQYNRLTGTVPDFLTNNTSPKENVNISYNDYKDFSTNSYFESATNVFLSENQFTFSDLVSVKANAPNSYSPQDSVDIKREVYSLLGGAFTLVMPVDTALASISGCKYQWFKYKNGTNDSALFVSPSATAYRYIVSNAKASDDGNKYYCIITHPGYPGLRLTGRLQTLIFSCKGVISNAGFVAKRYLCALNFKPTVDYTFNCNTVSYQWNFGDGSTSTERSPWHGYQNEGNYNVTLKINYLCGICDEDSTITKQVNYSLPEELVKDSTIDVPTEIKSEVLSVSAATFSDSWQLQHEQSNNLSSYKNGTQGVWRNDGMYVYDIPRSASKAPNLSKDGTFSLENFNYEMADINAIPHWTKATSMTQYSPYSYELENRDVLGIYSSALYDYGGHLPSANGVNMRNNEMAFTGFEYLDGNVTGNLIFGNKQLPEYYIYNVKVGNNHIAHVEASPQQLSGVSKVDVTGKGFLGSYLFPSKRSNYIQNDEIICIEPHPQNPGWSMVVLKHEPFPGIWIGSIKVKNTLNPIVTPLVDTTFAHTGRSSLKVSSETTFKQDLLKFDSAKRYFVNGWVSVKNLHLTTPVLAENIGIEVVFRNSSGTILKTEFIKPSGAIIEGWQQFRGSVVCPDKRTKVELKFKSGSATTAWFDDLRLHPEEGNMKSYVYNLTDYKLQAILDEENFATRYFYDSEGKLHLVKKETEKGVKTISENVSYQVEKE
jgi:Leucine-rich repeat (LRR) protein